MSALNKLIAGGIMVGMLAPALAFAQTSSTTSATTLVGQIRTLQEQIQALQAQKQVAVASLVSMLREGSTGDQVTILQALLAADPSIYPEGIISGYFGKLTAQAVKRFQKKHSIDQVGFVGPRTLKKLQEYLNERPLVFTTASSTATSTATNANRADNKGKRLCAFVPPGHLIAPGWLKKHKDEDDEDDDGDEDEDIPTVQDCREKTLPPGISKLINSGRGSTGSSVGSTTALTISNVSVSPIATTTATVTWTTNKVATSKVYYSTVTPLVLDSALIVRSGSRVTTHIMNLTGLTASTTYYYMVESKDATNKIATTSPESFSTTE